MLVNSKRFIKSYNAIDSSLRVQYNLKRSLSFTDVIRRTVVLNSIVRKFEDDLVDYSRLRNAIVHSTNEDQTIAEPHIDVVEKIEKIEKLITTPPRAYDSICRKDVLIIPPHETLKETIRKISSSGYSNIPVYDNGELIGIANGQKIINVIGVAINKQKNIDDFITNTTIGEIINSLGFEKYYAIASVEVTLESILNMFYENRKLLVIILTKCGTNLEPPLGVVTVSDIMDINSILDNFN